MTDPLRPLPTPEPTSGGLEPGSGTGAHPEPTARRTRWLLWAAASLLVAWPFLVVTVPPLADLPQHAAQVRLFGEALEGDSPYRIQWGTPYALAYLPLAAGMALLGPFLGPFAGPLAGARLGAALVALLWVAAVHLLAARLDRPPAAAVAASVLVFHHALYWGFLPFLVGFAVFVPWLLQVHRRPRGGAREAAAFGGLALLLYAAHALWFAAGLAWLALDALLRVRGGTPWRRLVPRLAGPAAVAVAAAAWYRTVAATSFATPPLWVPQTWRRLLPASWVEAAFGGLAGALEPVALAVLVGWLGIAAVAARRQEAARRQGEAGAGEAHPDTARDGAPGADPTRPDRIRPEVAGGWDRRLLLLGGLWVLAALLLPDKFTNTIEFNDRWLPPALALLLVAAPPLPLRRGLARAVAVTFLAAFVGVTALAWQGAEEEELAGLRPALAALPEEPALLGLDFVRGSRYLDRQPYLQTFAWGQVLRGGSLNFSFADFPPSPVVYDPPRKPTPWTPGLEWFPQLVRREDFGWFDHALVRAPEAIHRQMAGQPFLEPLTPPAPWRLYRVAEDAPRSVFTPPGAPPTEPPAAPPALTPGRRSTAPPAPTGPG